MKIYTDNRDLETTAIVVNPWELVKNAVGNQTENFSLLMLVDALRDYITSVEDEDEMPDDETFVDFVVSVVADHVNCGDEDLLRNLQSALSTIEAQIEDGEEVQRDSRSKPA